MSETSKVVGIMLIEVAVVYGSLVLVAKRIDAPIGLVDSLIWIVCLVGFQWSVAWALSQSQKGGNR